MKKEEKKKERKKRKNKNKKRKKIFVGHSPPQLNQKGNIYSGRKHPKDKWYPGVEPEMRPVAHLSKLVSAIKTHTKQHKGCKKPAREVAGTSWDHILDRMELLRQFAFNETGSWMLAESLELISSRCS